MRSHSTPWQQTPRDWTRKGPFPGVCYRSKIIRVCAAADRPLELFGLEILSEQNRIIRPGGASIVQRAPRVDPAFPCTLYRYPYTAAIRLGARHRADSSRIGSIPLPAYFPPAMVCPVLHRGRSPSASISWPSDCCFRTPRACRISSIDSRLADISNAARAHRCPIARSRKREGIKW